MRVCGKVSKSSFLSLCLPLSSPTAHSALNNIFLLSKQSDMSSTTAKVIPTMPELALTNPAEFLEVTGNRMVKAIERRPKEWDEKYNTFTKTFRDEVVSPVFF